MRVIPSEVAMVAMGPALVVVLVLAAVTSAQGAPGAPGAVTVGEPVPAAFAEAQVVDPDSHARPLADAWRERPAILIFLRHFG